MRHIIDRSPVVTLPATTELPQCPNHPGEDLIDVTFGLGPAEYVCRRCPISFYQYQDGTLVEMCPGCGLRVDTCNCSDFGKG